MAFVHRRSSTFALGLLALAFAAQPAVGQEADGLDALRRPDLAAGLDLSAFKQDFPEAKVRLDERTGFPRSITALNKKGDRLDRWLADELEPSRAVEAFFANQPRLFALSQDDFGVEVVGEEPDPNLSNAVLVRVQQLHGERTVFGAQAVVHVDQHFGVMGLESGFASITDVAEEPKVEWLDAVRRAIDAYDERTAPQAGLQALGARSEDLESDLTIVAELTILDPNQWRSAPGTEPYLAWMVEISGYRFFVDALTGEVRWSYQNVQSARQRETYDVQNRRRLPGRLRLNEASDADDLSAEAVDVAQAHRNAAVVYDYFESNFQRDSFDDAGAKIRSNARYDRQKNAYWDSRRKWIVYGPGYPAALDVVGHEYTHAVIDASSQLVYADEPGALNESLADFFGAMIESGGGQPDWQIGEDLPGSGGSPMRDMQNPGIGGFDPGRAYDPASNAGQPDHFDDYVDAVDPICASTTDLRNGCVHFNSGIFNKALQTMVSGGSFRGANHPGIGRKKVERMVYGAMLQLPSDSSMLTAGEILADYCRKLVGTHGISDADCDTVDAALEAVGLDVLGDGPT